MIKTVPYRENEKSHFFIFSQFPTEKTEKKGLFSQFRATEKLETENLRIFILITHAFTYFATYKLYSTISE